MNVRTEAAQVCGENPFSPQLYEISKYTETLKEFYSEHPFTHHLYPTIYSICFITNLPIHPLNHHCAVGSQKNNFEPSHVEKEKYSILQNKNVSVGDFKSQER